VLDAIRDLDDEGARALREGNTIYGLAAEFNAERDLSGLRTLRTRPARALGRRSLERFAGTADPSPAARHRRLRADGCGYG